MNVVGQVVGWTVALGGLGLAIRAGLLLAGRGRPQRGPTPAFVIAGPYRRVRNPLYAGVVLVLAGAALTSGSPAMAALAAGTAFALHGWVVTREEPALRRRFGAAYAAYLERVPRWVPRSASQSGDDQ